MIKLFTLVCILLTSSLADDLLSRTRSLMGTYVTISLPEKNNAEITHTFDLIQHIEDSLSTYDINATLAKLNQTHKVPYDSYLVEAIINSSCHSHILHHDCNQK